MKFLAKLFKKKEEPRPQPNRRITKEEAQEIIASGMTPREAYQAYPHAPNGAYDVAAGKTWRRLT